MKEQSSKVKRSELWYKIFAIVSQIPRANVEGDAYDAPSATTEIEKIILKPVPQPTDEEIKSAAPYGGEKMQTWIEGAIAVAHGNIPTKG